MAQGLGEAISEEFASLECSWGLGGGAAPPESPHGAPPETERSVWDWLQKVAKRASKACVLKAFTPPTAAEDPLAAAAAAEEEEDADLEARRARLVAEHAAADARLEELQEVAKEFDEHRRQQTLGAAGATGMMAGSCRDIQAMVAKLASEVGAADAYDVPMQRGAMQAAEELEPVAKRFALIETYVQRTAT